MKLFSFLIIAISVLNLVISTISIIRSLFFKKDVSSPKNQQNAEMEPIIVSNGSIVEHGRNPRQEPREEMDKLFIGRGFENDIVINNPTASKRHAEIFRIDDSYYIRDLNASNGTMVNGVRIIPSIGVELDNGDILQFGESSYRCFIGGGLIKIVEIP